MTEKIITTERGNISVYYNTKNERKRLDSLTALHDSCHLYGFAKAKIRPEQDGSNNFDGIVSVVGVVSSDIRENDWGHQRGLESALQRSQKEVEEQFESGRKSLDDFENGMFKLCSHLRLLRRSRLYTEQVIHYLEDFVVTFPVRGEIEGAHYWGNVGRLEVRAFKDETKSNLLKIGLFPAEELKEYFPKE